MLTLIIAILTPYPERNPVGVTARRPERDQVPSDAVGQVHYKFENGIDRCRAAAKRKRAERQDRFRELPEFSAPFVGHNNFERGKAGTIGR